MSEDIGESASGGLGVEFADFTAYTDLSVRAKHLYELLQEFHQAVGALVYNHGAVLVGQSINGRLTAFLMRQETEKDETRNPGR